MDNDKEEVHDAGDKPREVDGRRAESPGHGHPLGPKQPSARVLCRPTCRSFAHKDYSAATPALMPQDDDGMALP